MSKPKIDAHPSVLIAYCEKTGELLMSVYDHGYRQENYAKGSVNLIGGNPNIQDKSPMKLLEREIRAEFNPEPARKGSYKNKFDDDVLLWASGDDIEIVRKELLKGQSYKDFHTIITKDIEGGDKAGQAIFSTFYSEIDLDVMEIVRKNLLRGCVFTFEGLAGIVTIDDLKKDKRGMWAAAHGTPHILNEYFPGANISHPPEFQLEKVLGDVRDSYKDYFNEFDHYLDKRE